MYLLLILNYSAPRIYRNIYIYIHLKWYKYIYVSILILLYERKLDETKFRV